MTEEEKIEYGKLVDELVAKGGPTTGKIKLNQDPEKVKRLLELGWETEEPKAPKQIKFVSKIVKRDHGHVSDSFRDDIDSDVLRAEVRKLGYKPKIKTITRIKHIDLTVEGEYVTEFILDLKE